MATSDRGFASMKKHNPKKQREIARKGGKSSNRRRNDSNRNERSR